MTPQFLRSEAERFRDMAESTDREASRQRLLAMAVDYEAQAEQGEKLQPPEPIQAAEPEPASEGEIEPEPGVTSSPSRLRLSWKAGPCCTRLIAARMLDADPTEPFYLIACSTTIAACSPPKAR